jgi:hypothetical protein
MSARARASANTPLVRVRLISSRASYGPSLDLFPRPVTYIEPLSRCMPVMTLVTPVARGEAAGRVLRAERGRWCRHHGGNLDDSPLLQGRRARVHGSGRSDDTGRQLTPPLRVSIYIVGLGARLARLWRTSADQFSHVCRRSSR